MWFSVLLVLVSVYVLSSPSVCLDDMQLRVAEWPNFGKQLLIRFSLYPVYLEFEPRSEKTGLWGFRPGLT